MGLAEVVFPYRSQRQFGAASFSFVFIVLLAEIELLSLVGLLLVRGADLFFAMQAQVFPAAVLVSLAAATAFSLRARAWTRRRLLSIRAYDSGASRFGEALAKRR